MLALNGHVSLTANETFPPPAHNYCSSAVSELEFLGGFIQHHCVLNIFPPRILNSHKGSYALKIEATPWLAALSIKGCGLVQTHLGRIVRSRQSHSV